ncbi:MAG: glycosyltransferase family 2 protein, partial [bacterium]
MKTILKKLESNYVTPSDGYFALQPLENEQIHWDHCREQFAAKFTKNVTGFFFTYPKDKYEVVVVDDGSKDGSLQEILSLRESDSRVKAITFTRNFGQMAAMLAGFKAATGDAVINISADMQDPVELIPQMVEKWQGGAEIVICHRTDRSDTLLSKVFSRLAYGVLRIS